MKPLTRISAALLGVGLLSGVALAQGGPFAAQIENFWRLISTGGRTFTTIKIAGATVTNVTTLVVTDAQTKALPTTPLVVVPAPGAGKWLVPIMAILETNWVGTYTNVTDATLNQGATDLVVTYGQNFVNAFRPVPIGPFIGGDTKKVAYAPPSTGVSDPVVVTDQLWAPVFGFTFNGMDKLENNPLYIAADNGGGNFTGGNASNQLVVTVYYMLRTYQSATP